MIVLNRSQKPRLSLICVAALIVAGTAALPLLATGDPQGVHEHHRHHQHPTPAGNAAQSKALGAESTSDLAIPDMVLLDQDGREVRFYTDLVKDRVVAINFIFTTCTTVCPPMGANFSKLQKLMGKRDSRDFHLISVSVDPAVDTPPRLKRWAEKFGRQPGWTLVTGSKPEVDKLLKALKVFTPDKSDHSPIVLLGDDARHEWTRAYGLAPASKLAEMVGELLDAPREPAAEEGR